MLLKLFFATLGFLALIGAAECLARLAIRRGRYFVLPPGQRERNMLHRESHPQLEPVVRLVVNRLGERGRPLPKRGRVYRVLVVGGSAAESYTQDQDTQWPAALEAALRTPASLRLLAADDAYVGNIGRSGVDSGSLDVILSRVLPNYRHLDLIVIMVGASDVLRWLEAGAPPSRSAAPLTEAELFSWNPSMKFGYSPRSTALFTWFRRLREQFWVERRNVARWMGRARRDRANALTIREDTPSPDVVLEAFRANMASVIRRAREVAARVLVVGQPWFEKAAYTPEEEALFWNGAVGQAYKGTVTEFFSTRVICSLMGEIDVAAERLAVEAGVEFLRLQERVPASVEQFIDHFHSTPAGAARIGRLVAGAVLDPSGPVAGLPRK